MELREKFLHHIWDQRHLQSDLLTVTGKPVRIVYQGQYNTGSGPDFRNVILDLAGETLQGDVEIHLKTYDWNAHQHQEDPGYNNTILHVVLEHKSNLDYTIREDAGRIEILEIKDQIDTDIAKLFARFSDNPAPGHSGICDFFTLSSNEELVPIINSYGYERFVRKCSRFNAELHFDGFDQLLYNGFMEAMGYSKNKFNMLSIAHHYTWNKLCGWKNSDLDGISIAAVWLNYAGLMDSAGKLLNPAFYSEVTCEFEKQNFSAEKGRLNWNLFRIRPANHPVRRIIQSSYTVVSLLEKGFLNSLLEIFTAGNSPKTNEIINRISILLNPGTNADSSSGKIGKTLVLTITGNVILPVLNLFAEKTHNLELLDMIRKLYSSFPTFESNHIISFMNGYLDDSQKKLFNSSYIMQQGMMNLYYRFCSYRLCDMCMADKEKATQNL